MYEKYETDENMYEKYEKYETEKYEKYETDENFTFRRKLKKNLTFKFLMIKMVIWWW